MNSISKNQALTFREQEIIIDIAAGLSSKEIAYNYRIALNTVWAHRRNIIKKMNCTNMAAAIACFVKNTQNT